MGWFSYHVVNLGHSFGRHWEKSRENIFSEAPVTFSGPSNRLNLYRYTRTWQSPGLTRYPVAGGNLDLRAIRILCFTTIVSVSDIAMFCSLQRSILSGECLFGLGNDGRAPKTNNEDI